jgi:putative hemolysin
MEMELKTEISNELISQAEFTQISGLGDSAFKALSAPLFGMTGIPRLNRYYRQLPELVNFDFINYVLSDKRVKLEIDEASLELLRRTGSFVAVSNHPFGILDGLLLLKLLGMVRNDVKIPTNFVLSRVRNIQDLLLNVNPMETVGRSNLKGLRAMKQHLNDGGVLGLFPAGEVSSFQKGLRVEDKVWNKTAIKFIQNSGVPVVPIYFHGKNSALFHVLGLIHPMLRTGTLSSEFFKKENLSVKVKVGKAIMPREISQFDSTTDFGQYLRAKVYAQGTKIPVAPFFERVNLSTNNRRMLPLADSIHSSFILNEIEALSSDQIILEKAGYRVYIAQTEKIPAIMHEIGRLRESTFRAAGEGTGQERDLDRYDLYYHQLFLWDTKAKQIVGGYRIGMGSEIMSKYSKQGFYISSLFKFRKPFNELFTKTIELGRSFIIPEYQQKALPLYLIWSALLKWILKNPGYRYLLGPVSISNSYSRVSRCLMVKFIRKYCFDNELAKLVSPKKAFKPRFKKSLTDSLVDVMNADLKKLESVIADIEDSTMRVPVLLKKYIKQNAKIIGFNVDPNFNDALDGLMILDIEDLPKNTLEELQRGLRK